jgi:hypothetical protein
MNQSADSSQGSREALRAKVNWVYSHARAYRFGKYLHSIGPAFWNVREYAEEMQNISITVHPGVTMP